MTEIERPPDWVPVDRRVWGMDRRTLLPALVVALWGALVYWGLPAVNDAIAVTNPIQAGDVIQLGDAAQLTPAADWDLAAGVRQGQAGATGYPAEALVTRDGVSVAVATDTFDGTAASLLAQIRANNDEVPGGATVQQEVPFTTQTGQPGVITKFTTPTGEGLIAAFVFDGTGVEVVVSGPGQIPPATEAAVVRMLESIQPVTT